MIRRGLLCAVLLLASPTLPLAEQAATPPNTQSETKSNGTPEQLDADFSQGKTTLGAPPRPMRLDCTPAPRARGLVGTYGCVSGRVDRIVFTNQGNIRLYLCPEDECSFHATIYGEDVEKVGSVLHLQDRLVAIDGNVTLFRGAPEIKIMDRHQISVTAGSLHEGDPAPPGTVKENRKQLPTKKKKVR